MILVVFVVIGKAKLLKVVEAPPGKVVPICKLVLASHNCKLVREVTPEEAYVNTKWFQPIVPVPPELIENLAKVLAPPGVNTVVGKVTLVMVGTDLYTYWTVPAVPKPCVVVVYAPVDEGADL